MIRDWFARARDSTSDGSAPEIREVKVDDIASSPYQPRRAFGEEQLRELADSISQVGVIEPVLVRRSPKGEGQYQLVVGERRVRACRLAGLERVPAVVRDVDDEQVALLGLTENLQREDLHFIEEAEAFRRIIDEFGLTQGEVARRLGMKQSTISNKLRLLTLDQDLRRTLRVSGLGERHARALLRLPEAAAQREVLAWAVEGEVSVRQMDAMVERVLTGEDERSPRRQRVTRFARDLRIYLNSLNDTVEMMRESGLKVDVERADREESYEVVIRIAKDGMRSDVADSGDEARGDDTGA